MSFNLLKRARAGITTGAKLYGPSLASPADSWKEGWMGRRDLGPVRLVSGVFVEPAFDRTQS